MNALHLERLISKGGSELTRFQRKLCALSDTLFVPQFTDIDYGHINIHNQACRNTAAKTIQIYFSNLVMQNLLI